MEKHSHMRKIDCLKVDIIKEKVLEAAESAGLTVLSITLSRSRYVELLKDSYNFMDGFNKFVSHQNNLCLYGIPIHMKSEIGEHVIVETNDKNSWVMCLSKGCELINEDCKNSECIVDLIHTS